MLRKYGLHTYALTALALSALPAAACAPEEQDGDDSSSSTSASAEDEATPHQYGAGTSNAKSGKAVTADANDEETISKGFLLKTRQGNAEIFSWSTPGGGANRADVLMKPRNTHICFLSRFSGNLGGNSYGAVHKSTTNADAICPSWPNSDPFLIKNDSADTWKLGGCQRESNSMTLEATCIPAANFRIDPGGVVVYSAVKFAEIQSLSCPQSQSTDLASVETVAFLTAIGGYFNGGGEMAEIIPGSSGVPTKLRVETNACRRPAVTTDIDAAAISLYAGVPGRTAVRRSRHTVSADSDQTRTQTLAMTSAAICYLTRISGKFDGSPERVRIYPEVDANGTEWWKLEAKAGGQGKVYASAECAGYDQTEAGGPLF
jgi:hypothetical protein